MHLPQAAPHPSPARPSHRRPGPEATRLPPGPAASTTEPILFPDDTTERCAIHRSAVLSPDRRYRYILQRTLEPEPNKTMTVIGLNPSTADETTDDATTRRVISFARAARCGRVQLLNLFAWRATAPEVLRRMLDPIGPGNDDWIRTVLAGTDIVVAAWGASIPRGSAGARAAGTVTDRVATVMEMLRHHTIWCLGTTKDGHPRHPLYIANGTPLQEYAAARHTWDPPRHLPWGRRDDRLVQRFCPCGADEISRLPPGAGPESAELEPSAAGVRS